MNVEIGQIRKCKYSNKASSVILIISGAVPCSGSCTKEHQIVMSGDGLIYKPLVTTIISEYEIIIE